MFGILIVKKDMYYKSWCVKNNKLEEQTFLSF